MEGCRSAEADSSGMQLWNQTNNNNDNKSSCKTSNEIWGEVMDMRTGGEEERQKDEGF